MRSAATNSTNCWTLHRKASRSCMPHSSPPAQPRESSAPRELVVATANPGKLREFRALLAGLPFKLRGLAELGLPSPDETGSTFVANAAVKARHAARLSG